MKTINCAECNIEYTYEPAKGYPDKRKYCANCSEKKKVTWEDRGEVPVELIKTTTTEVGLNIDTKPKPTKEFHLSPEQVRTNALGFAIAVCEREREKAPVDLIELAVKFEEYLWHGK